LDIEVLCSVLRRRLYEAVKRNLSSCLLLSGGVDTSILAAVSSILRRMTGITVAVEDDSPDLRYARLVAERFNLEHFILKPSEAELMECVGHVVRVVRTFDPMEVRGSSAVCYALSKAKELGFASVMTGDGGDELFAGYTFYLSLSREELEEALRRIWRVMSFSSKPLAESMGMEAKLPYLDEKFKEFAMQIDADLKVRWENGRKWGKWILRKAFETVIPQEVIWREKLHVSAGSGVEGLLARIANRIDDSEYLSKRKKYYEDDEVKLTSKEHLLYYEIFRREHGVPRELTGPDRRCPSCKAPLYLDNFCKVCGAYPIRP